MAADKTISAEHNWLVNTILTLLGVNAVFIVIMIVLFNIMPGPLYYEHRADGTVNPIYALDVPMVAIPALLQWANQAAIESYTFGFDNYVESLEGAKQYFTPNGWDDFQAALEKSQLLSTVIDKKLKVSAVTTGAPVIISQGFIFGIYQWRVQMPLLVTYESASEKKQSKMLVTLVIARVSTRDVLKGIAVTQFFAMPLGGNVGGLA
ncbi:MAG: type IVB secretion system apparatus protein IcmL/DotI [Pseudomonadota bacterium]|nr:type IVB secretion system apparatus protein IcmL/DotI [Pseudomonadota bacterium]